MSRLAGYGLSAALLVGAAAVAGMLISQRPEPVQRELAPRVPVALIEAAVAGSGPIVVHATGTVRPGIQVDVAAGISGQVVWVDPAFQTGGRVGRDQVLFRIDDADHRHQVDRARADVTVQKVELLKVEEKARVARDQFELFRRTDPEAPADAGPLALWEPQIEAARAALDRQRAALAEAELGTVAYAGAGADRRGRAVRVGGGGGVRGGRPDRGTAPCPGRGRGWRYRYLTPTRRFFRICGTCAPALPTGASRLV